MTLEQIKPSIAYVSQFFGMALEWDVPELACAYSYIDDNGQEQTQQIRPEG
jgi:hypothetical protein